MASLGAIGSILAATSCCWPVLPFVFAAGTAGGSVWLARLRPYLLAVSALFVVFGFYPKIIFDLIEGSLRNLILPLQ